MKIFDNVTEIVRDDMAQTIKKGSKVYDTFGPFMLVGGIAKGHPTADEIRKAVEFYKGLES